MGHVFMFVLVATVTLDSGRHSWQTLGYYETAAQCQTARIQAEQHNREREPVGLACHPIRAVP